MIATTAVADWENSANRSPPTERLNLSSSPFDFNPDEINKKADFSNGLSSGGKLKRGTKNDKKYPLSWLYRKTIIRMHEQQDAACSG